MNESVVCGCQQVHNSEVHHLGVVGTDLRWTEIGLLLFSDFDFFLGSLYGRKVDKNKFIHFRVFELRLLTISKCFLLNFND